MLLLQSDDERATSGPSADSGAGSAASITLAPAPFAARKMAELSVDIQTECVQVRSLTDNPRLMLLVHAPLLLNLRRHNGFVRVTVNLMTGGALDAAQSCGAAVATPATWHDTAEAMQIAFRPW